MGKLVEGARRVFRRHRQNLSLFTWQEYLEANRYQVAAMSKAKRQYFEGATEKVCKEEGKSLWRLGKGAKSKGFLPLTPPSIPSLTTPQGPATTLDAKCDTLKGHIFPYLFPLLISDIPDFQYPVEKPSSTLITIEEIVSACSKARSHKAPEPNGIPI
jgi:hypothetical protein